MTDTAVTVREAAPDDMDRIEELLDASGLPTADVRGESVRFVVAVDDDGIAGAGGLELYESAGLLRSVVVAASNRDRGYGTAVCDRLEADARADGVEWLYLLTTTAPAFFRRRGYEEIERDAAPSSIRETTEFSSLCPDSALCMRKRLG